MSSKKKMHKFSEKQFSLLIHSVYHCKKDPSNRFIRAEFGLSVKTIATI